MLSLEDIIELAIDAAEKSIDIMVILILLGIIEGAIWGYMTLIIIAPIIAAIAFVLLLVVKLLRILRLENKTEKLIGSIIIAPLIYPVFLSLPLGSTTVYLSTSMFIVAPILSIALVLYFYARFRSTEVLIADE